MAIEAGAKTVTTSGSPEQLVGSSTPVKSVAIQAKHGNTGSVYLGSSGTQDVELLPGESFPLAKEDGTTFDLSNIWVDVDTDGEGVNFIGVT